MHQLLQGFGSEILVDEVLGLKLNCKAVILREEIEDTEGIMHAIIECECMDPEFDNDYLGLELIKNEWEMQLRF
jgi:hypothetical protein